MRQIIAGLIVAIAAGSLAGCGGGGLQTGMPRDTTPPKDFDPGGGVQIDMTGKAQSKATPPR